MKYFNGSLVRQSVDEKSPDCIICGKKSLSYKIREDKELVCLSCWAEDTKSEYLQKLKIKGEAQKSDF